MSSFVNTVESVGDEALTNSIIDRSITELADDISTTIGQYAFRTCTKLTNVNFPSVTSTGVGAFYGCTTLAKAEFASSVAFGNNTFYNCSALTALILRNTEAISNLTGGLSGTPIASGTGYIYVPSALVDTYKATSGWSSYADQICAIEDYPEVCDPYSWEAVFAAIDNGTYASVYKIGDLIPLDLGDEGLVNMQIVAFDADNLADGSGKAPISWISKELLATPHNMNNSSASDVITGWENSQMQTYLNDTIKPLIPETVRNHIASVTKTQPARNGTTDSYFIQTTQDEVWIPSEIEITASQRYYSAFPDEASRIKCISGSTSTDYWWLRTADRLTDNVFKLVNSSGYVNSNYGYILHYVALGFCT